MKTKHHHQYNKIVLKRVNRIKNPNYKGTAGDKAFLFHVCECRDYRAFDYGSHDAMKTKMEKLLEA